MPEENLIKSSTNLSSDQNLSNDYKNPQNDLAYDQRLKRRRFKLILVCCVLFILIISLLGALFIYRNIQKSFWSQSSEAGQSISSPSAQKSEISNNNVFDLPELYPGLEWEAILKGETKKTLRENALYTKQNGYDAISLSGDEWEAVTEKPNTDEINNLISDFRNYYAVELEKHGWADNYRDHDYDLMPLEADGLQGSIWGYIKVKNGMYRVILLQYSHDSMPATGEPKCPCGANFRVFASEIKPLSELSKEN